METIMVVAGLAVAADVILVGDIPPLLKSLMDGDTSILSRPGDWFGFLKTLGGGGGGGGATAPTGAPVATATGGAAGTCSTTIYPKTGRVLQLPGHDGTRNYASGKPSEPTHENEADGDSSWKNYEMTTYFTLPASGDDAVDHKMYGPHHEDGNKAWYVYGVSTGGEAVCGAEETHPNPNPKTPCKGGTKTSFGSLLGKRSGLKTAIWTDAAGDVTVESYLDAGTGKWEKMSSMKNPGGWKYAPTTPQNFLFRADGLKGIKVECSTVQEIVPPGGTAAPTAPAGPGGPSPTPGETPITNPGVDPPKEEKTKAKFARERYMTYYTSPRPAPTTYYNGRRVY